MSTMPTPAGIGAVTHWVWPSLRVSTTAGWSTTVPPTAKRRLSSALRSSTATDPSRVNHSSLPSG